MPRLLVASQDHGLHCVFATDPELSGVEVSYAGSAPDLLHDVEQTSPEIVVLDDRLPESHVTELLPQLVASGCGVLVVSADLSELDLVLWLELGADDVLARPYSTPELRARVHAVLRRRRRSVSVSSSASPADFRLDPDTRSVVVGGRAMHVPPLEFAVLNALGARDGVPVPREVLLQECWSTASRGRPEYVDAVIRRLRVRLEPEPSEPQHIVTVRSKGYALRP